MGRRLLFWTVACLSLCLTGCRRTPEVMDLSGVWQLALAPSPADWDQLAFCDDFGDTASLPGTLDENQKGTPVTDTTTMHLNRVYTFTGTAWFSREVEIPASWKGLGAVLYLERTKLSAVWVDGVKVGVSTILSASQQYDLRQILTPGRHRLTIAVNNDPALHTVGGSHAYTDHTQTNW
ncbi:MAG: beta-glycosidase, partial [Bacteroidales bacterium]|nr:beta-glycosidase [Bacteroidales bacterium]